MLFLITAILSSHAIADVPNYDCQVFVGQEVVTDKINDIFTAKKISVQGVTNHWGDELSTFTVDQDFFDSVQNLNEDLSISEKQLKPDFSITDVKDGFSVKVEIRKSTYCPITNPQCYWAYRMDIYFKVYHKDQAGKMNSQVIKIESEPTKDQSAYLKNKLEFFGTEDTDRQPFMVSVGCKAILQTETTK